MIPIAYTFVAKASFYQSAPYQLLEGVRAAAKAKLLDGYSSIDILLLIGGSEYLVEQVISDPCHKITYYAITKSCEGVEEVSYEEPSFTDVLAWANRVAKMSRIVEVQIYLKVAGRKHLIDIIEAG